jgi:2-keto-4-pentenoate hydratase
MTPEQIDEFATTVWAAREGRRTLDADDVTQRCDGPHTMDDAYRVQAAIVERRAERGERHVGWKLGYTSEAMRRQMGVAQPNFGPLTDAMLLSDGDAVPDSVIQPRVEPEIAVRLGRDVRAPVTIDEVLTAVEGAMSCLEVVDSVWNGYRFRIEHNTADGSSAAHVVLGPTIPLGDLAATTVTLRRNGEEIARSTGAAASGHPLAGVVWLADRLAEQDRHLRAGDIVITGGLTAAAPLEPGDTIAATFDDDIAVSVHRPRPDV